MKGESQANRTPAPGPTLDLLMVRIGQGDDAALGELFDQTRATVFGLILRIVTLPALAEETLMDVYLQIWQQAPRFNRGRGSAYTWIMLLARSRALDILRRERRGRRFDWESFSEGFEVVDPGRSPETHAGLAQIVVRFRATFQQLTEDQRRVVELAFYEDLSHSEIANRLQLPLGTVKTRIRGALNRFRETLNPKPRTVNTR